MLKPISLERWQQAQEGERKCHVLNRKEGERHYRHVYEVYFGYLGMEFDQKGKTICEIGCADFPALQWCKDYVGLIVEPMPSPILEEIVKGMERYTRIYNRPFEELQMIAADEIWLFNVMQHIIDPEKFIENCKRTGKVIRFFEPVEYDVELCHPHRYEVEDFQRWFGDCVQIYDYNPICRGFHTHKCCYGTYVNV